MICKSLEGYVRTTHGGAAWAATRKAAKLPFAGFETLLSYEDEQFVAVQAAAADVLERTTVALMEDVGTWICTHPPLGSVRRLFRFSGSTFLDLLLSLDEIDARARMAVPELDLPVFCVSSLGEGDFEVTSSWSVPGASGLLTGALRAMADEYGALAMIDIEGSRQQSGSWLETVFVCLFEEDFHAPKTFALGGGGL